MDRKRFLIFRIYTNKQKKEENKKNYLYGWTYSKNILKAFFMQRDKSKYDVVKISDDEIGEIYSENYIAEDLELDYVNIKFASNGKVLKFYTNKDELATIEMKIHTYFSNLCSFSEYDVETIDRLVKLFGHLENIYDEALEVIGFRPSELDSLFPGHDDEINYDGIAEELFNAYSVYELNKKHVIPGLNSITDLSKVILYSVENFVKVAKEDM